MIENLHSLCFKGSEPDRLKITFRCSLPTIVQISSSLL